MSDLPLTVMPVRLFAPIGYYMALAQQQRVVVDTAMPFDKRAKAVHRYDIVDTQGRCQLTVPINRPHSGSPTDRPLWTDATVSRHGQWWRLHRTALESAYGRTPFFEYLIDRFDTVLCDPADPAAAPNVVELARRADALIRPLLLLDTPVEWRPLTTEEADAIDLRRADFTLTAPQPYWQVRQSKLGFQPNLSILDALFNLGPEAALLLPHRLHLR
ncbi:MAG: WbqC family protein [Bacteroidales bacterium]|nr:WbqC family protein [Bacteroidales bacterium]